LSSGGHVELLIGTKWGKSHVLMPMNICNKFGSIWPTGFREEDVLRRRRRRRHQWTQSDDYSSWCFPSRIFILGYNVHVLDDQFHRYDLSQEKCKNNMFISIINLSHKNLMRMQTFDIVKCSLLVYWYLVLIIR
jgi:hypothetical protein